ALQFLAGLFDGQGDPLFIERLQNVVNRVDLKGLHSILVIGGGKNDLRNGYLPVQQLLDHGKAIQSRHLHVQEHEVRRVLFNEVNGFQAIGSMGNDVYIVHRFEQITEFVPGELFVINNDGG